MAKQKRNLLDDLAARLRGLLDDLDRLMNPQPTAKPVRVPAIGSAPRVSRITTALGSAALWESRDQFFPW